MKNNLHQNMPRFLARVIESDHNTYSLKVTIAYKTGINTWSAMFADNLAGSLSDEELTEGVLKNGKVVEEKDVKELFRFPDFDYEIYHIDMA